MSQGSHPRAVAPQSWFNVRKCREARLLIYVQMGSQRGARRLTMRVSRARSHSKDTDSWVVSRSFGTAFLRGALRFVGMSAPSWRSPSPLSRLCIDHHEGQPHTVEVLRWWDVGLQPVSCFSGRVPTTIAWPPIIHLLELNLLSAFTGWSASDDPSPSISRTCH